MEEDTPPTHGWQKAPQEETKEFKGDSGFKSPLMVKAFGGLSGSRAKWLNGLIGKKPTTQQSAGGR